MIEVNNLTAEKIKKGFLIKVARRVFQKEKRALDLSIALVGPARIKALNKKYRKKNKATDVLSFLYSDQSGEVVICPDEVEKNGLARVLIHGVLHLLGYTHEKSQKGAKLMEQQENYYLKLFFK